MRANFTGMVGLESSLCVAGVRGYVETVRTIDETWGETRWPAVIATSRSSSARRRDVAGDSRAGRCRAAVSLSRNTHPADQRGICSQRLTGGAGSIHQVGQNVPLANRGSRSPAEIGDTVTTSQPPVGPNRFPDQDDPEICYPEGYTDG